jgi:hypothetical protein
MVILWTSIGALIILITLRDVAHELFHPEQSGSISRSLMRGIWAILRRIGTRFPSILKHAGPSMLFGVVGVWLVLAVLGWALIYWPRLPEQYNVNPGVPPSAAQGLLTAAYVSLAVTTTLGASDITPKLAMVRYATALEAIVGLVILTAWITWVLSIFPVIADRRAFAREIALLRRAHEDQEATVRELPTEILATLLRTMTERVLCTHSQLVQSPVSYYFQQRESKGSLVAQLPWLTGFARTAEANASDAVRHHARMLVLAIDDLLDLFGREFLSLEDAPEQRILEALVHDHMREEEVYGSAQEGALEHTR